MAIHPVYFTFAPMTTIIIFLLGMNFRLSGDEQYRTEGKGHAYTTERIEQHIGAIRRCEVGLMIQDYNAVGYVMREGRLWVARDGAPSGKRWTVMLLARGVELLV